MSSHQLQRIPLDLECSNYEVLVGCGGLEWLGDELKTAQPLLGSRVLVVSNPNIAIAYADRCLDSLRRSGFEPTLLVIEAGEDRKTLATVSKIHDAAWDAKLERRSLMVALGGGVVGDMTGFAASTWLRGIAVAQVPTTLLAMVDAAIGGKTGVNHPRGKNLIGAFHQPKLVLIDPEMLSTLPTREFRAGMAEVIKYGVIGDPNLFRMLERADTLSDPAAMPMQLLNDILVRSVMVKAGIVMADEHERGLRAILNYGHTFGHAVETLCGYGHWLHGEAVAIGMATVGEMATQLGHWNRKDADRQRALIEQVGLPTHWPDLNLDTVLRTLQADKKVHDGVIRFIIPRAIGHVEVRSDISYLEIMTCLQRFL